jgi:diaminopimelate epimerase
MRFHKFQACGNDFLVVRESVPGGVTGRGAAFFERLCDRHFGIGADGVEVLVATGTGAGDPAVDATVRLFNADGGETPISGNGTRCVGAYLYLVEGWQAPVLRIATGAGVRELRPGSRAQRTILFETLMGRPGLTPEEIPVRLPEPLDQVIEHPLPLMDGGTVRFTGVSMGNPHCSLFLEGEEPFEATDWRTLGALLERHAAFPERTNVEFIRVLDQKTIEVRFWERGCGETLSSGTGSCAAALAAMRTGRTDREVTVRTVAGDLRVQWRPDGTVWQTGEASYVFSGEWELDGEEELPCGTGQMMR